MQKQFIYIFVHKTTRNKETFFVEHNPSCPQKLVYHGLPKTV